MSNYFGLDTLRPERAKSRAQVEQLLTRLGHSLKSGEAARAFADTADTLWDDDAAYVGFVWRWLDYFGGALARMAGVEDYFEVTDDPITWTMYGRHPVPETDRVRYNTPEDVAAIAARLAAVTAHEFDAALTAAYETPSRRRPERRSRSERALASVTGEMVFWGTLRAFYVRAAIERRYVVSL